MISRIAQGVPLNRCSSEAFLIKLRLASSDSARPQANRVDSFAHQVWRDAVGGPVEVQVQVAAKGWAVGIAAPRCAEDDADSLVDIA